MKWRWESREQPFIIPDDICSKRPMNLSRNALSILEGVSIIFYFYFNCPSGCFGIHVIMALGGK